MADQTPATVRCDDDPGDETQRNFRYQHAYGVILLLAAQLGRIRYVSVICEQHEDFLCERADGRYDAWQVKTSRPENGAFTLNTEALRHSIHKFIKLDMRFPGVINCFHFVSNTDVSDSTSNSEAARSPYRLVEAARAPVETSQISAFGSWINEAATQCGANRDQVISTLCRVQFTKGPGRDSFRSEILADHLSTLPDCRGLDQRRLGDLLDGLVAIVARASALDIRDASRHWLSHDERSDSDPTLLAKRISVAELSALIAESRSCPFAFAPTRYRLPLGNGSRLPVLDTKLARGDLGDYIDLMRQRTISAEQHLLEMAARLGDDAEPVVNQIANVVEGECQEAHLAASMGGTPFGKRMLLDVFSRLRQTAQQRPGMVHEQEYELLSGVAGLLTEDCKIWWSERFDPNGEES